VVGSGHVPSPNTTSPIAVITIWCGNLTSRATTSLVRVGRRLTCVRFHCPGRVGEKIILELALLRFPDEAGYAGFVRWKIRLKAG
jgi:hypothetical protein